MSKNKPYGERAAQGAVDWRGKGSMHSFGANKELTSKFNKFCKKAKVSKSEVIREALELLILNNTTKEVNEMAKAKKAFDWKGLVTTLHELQADVPAARLAEFIKEKGVTVSTRTIGAVRANLSRG